MSDTLVNKLVSGLRDWVKDFHSNSPRKAYTAACASVNLVTQDVDIPKDLVNELLTSIGAQQWEPRSQVSHFGLYVSAVALLVARQHGEVSIDTSCLTSGRSLPTLDYLLYQFEGNAQVSGNVGDYFCDQARPGNVALDGHADDYVCRELCGTHVNIRGSVGSWAGKNAESGELEVYTAEHGFGAYNNGAKLTAARVKDRAAYYHARGTTIITEECGNDPAYGAAGGRVELHGKCGKRIGWELDGCVVDVYTDLGEGAGNLIKSGIIILRARNIGITASPLEPKV
ncbi:hypothetical protein HY642_03275 [Candidatus Woesearchaeota archaeon]|nr:hypothetical protein [Candidatus Woesearchaeota archaeon]